jgi:hypothetical protein
MRDLIKAIPPMQDLAQQAGLELPSVLGKISKDDAPKKMNPGSAKPAEKDK